MKGWQDEFESIQRATEELKKTKRSKQSLSLGDETVRVFENVVLESNCSEAQLFFAE